MKHSPSSFSLVLQVGAIMLATLLVVLIFFRIRPSVLSPLTLQESVQNVIEKNSPATVMIVSDEGIIGGGVLVEPTIVLTSKHLVQIGNRYGVRFGHDIVWGTPVSLHPELDLAILMLETEYSHPVTVVGSKTSLLPGDFVIAFGILTRAQSFVHHFGIISSTDATLMLEKHMRGLIVTDIPFQGGYSGAPLFNLRGELIGIHTAFGVGENVGWSTPVDQKLLTDWKKSLN